jgi:hypothetical protein
MMAWVLAAEGLGPATAGLPPLILCIMLSVLALSLVVARLGVARPELDVYAIVVRRPQRPELALPGISLGASVVQLLINMGPYPAVKVLSPSVLYQPAFGPSSAVLGWSLAVTAVLTLAAVAAWWGRLTWHAPRQQQREAERFA